MSAVRLVDQSALLITRHHDPAPRRRRGFVVDSENWSQWGKTFRSAGSPEIAVGESPQVFADREFDIVNRTGRPLFSGFEAGPVDVSLRRQALEATAPWRGVRLVVYEVGVDRRHPCCLTLVRGKPTPAGMRCEAWMSHGWQTDGPEGWHLRVYGADGTLRHQATLDDLDYRARPRCCDPARAYWL